MIVDYVKPEYGVNYGRGYVFGTNEYHDLIHGGIAWFQRWDRMDLIKCQHVGIVTDEHTVIQAHVHEGVHEASLDELLENPRIQIFFREPKGLTPELADRIVGTAASRLGAKYDRGLIVAHALTDTFLGRLADKLTDGSFEEMVAQGFDDPMAWICSELVADALDTQPEYRDVGVLSKSNAAITPQEIIQDAELFKPWKNK